MKQKSKTIAILIAALLTFSMTASVMLIPNANAHTPAWQIKTYAYINAAPDPVGVGQRVSVDMWLSMVLPGAEPINNIRWQNYGLAITAPNGQVTTENWTVVSDPTANQDYYFSPTQTGTYTLTFNFPGMLYTWTTEPSFFGGSVPDPYAGDTYLPSSASTTLTVQTAQLTTIPSAPLPTQFWTRPIYGENSNWWIISSNWLGTGSPGYSSGMMGATFQPYDVGSLTSHIMWTKPMQSGGVVGGNNFVIQGDTYAEGSAYATRYSNPIIIDGMLYYTEPLSFAGVAGAMVSNPYGPTVCVNLETGQQVWSSSTVPGLSFGYVYDMQDPNEHGVWPPILVASVGGSFLGPPVPVTWECYDGDTGTFLFDVTNVPAGTALMGPEGEYLIVSLVNLGPVNMFGIPTGPPNYYLQEWNSSRLWDNEYSGPSTTPSVVPPITNGSDPSLLDWNVSVSSLNSLTASPTIESMAIVEAGTMPNAGDSFFAAPSWTPYTYVGINLNPNSGTIGTELWKNTITPPAGNLTISYDGAEPTANGGAGVFVEYYTETMQFVGYSMTTGQRIWGPTSTEASLNYFATGWNGEGPTLAYGNLYTGGMSGIVYCYSLTTGNLLWTYGNGGPGNSTNAGLNWATNYPTYISAITNGVIYTVTGEHTFETPIYKGALARAINATTGQEIWTVSDADAAATSYALADGYNTFFNGYDNQIYVVGKGPSATTANVEAFGNSVVISGTVTDISPGTTQTEQAADFPHGVPCASDASMTEWMGYVYQQQAKPTDFVGVPVTVSVTDSNGNHYTIGGATTDENGFYTLTWTPIVPGNFTASVNFAGTNGYYPSSAEASFYASPPTATTAPTASPVSGLASTGTVELGVAVIVIVIVIIGAILAVLTLRKRP